MDFFDDLVLPSPVPNVRIPHAWAGLLPFPIAYQQEFFNQLTSEEVRTRLVRGIPCAIGSNRPAREARRW
ncbi:MAG TPA: hypothetical protein VIH18_19775, partial [Candidatus Binatia bacterium]